MSQKQQECNTELDARIERVKRYQSGVPLHVVYPQVSMLGSSLQDHVDDLSVLADAYIAHLDAEAERKRERAELVTEEWLLSVLGDDWYNESCDDSNCQQWYSIENKWSCWKIEFRRVDKSVEFDVVISGSHCVTVFREATKGQVLDLIAALNGEA